MDKTSVKESIIRSLDNIIDKTSNLEKFEEQIPQVELDIILKDIQQLYENYKLLAKINNKELEGEIEQHSINSIIEKSEQTFSKIKTISETPAKEQIGKIYPNEENDQKNEAFKDTSVEDNKTIEKEQKPNVEEEAGEEEEIIIEQYNQQIKQPVNQETGSETVADKYKNTPQSLNEKLRTTASDNSIAAKLQQDPIKELRSSIGLNEKILFVKELFNENNEEYRKVLSKLDSMPDLTTAMELVNALKLRYSWDDSKESYKLFINYIKRRFTS